MNLNDLQLTDLQDAGLRLAVALLALILIWLFRRVVARIAMPRLRRLAQRTDSDLDDTLVNAFTTPFRIIIIALALYVATTILSPGGVSPFIGSLTRSLIIVAVFLLLYKATGVIMRTTALLTSVTGLQISEQLLPFVRTGLQVIIIALGVITVLQEWTDVGGLIAGLGLGGLAFALAAEDTIANIFGFTTIVGDRPLVQGEFINTPDVSGTVEHVGFRSTRIRQLDQAVVTIPNSTLANSVITNWSRLEKRRLDFTIGVTYDASSNQLRELIERLQNLLQNRETVDSESVNVLFTSFGASSLDIRLICYIYMAAWGDFMREQQEIMFAIMDIVEELGLRFAFPSQSLYIEQVTQQEALQTIPDRQEPTETPSA